MDRYDFALLAENAFRSNTERELLIAPVVGVVDENILLAAGLVRFRLSDGRSVDRSRLLVASLNYRAAELTCSDVGAPMEIIGGYWMDVDSLGSGSGSRWRATADIMTNGLAGKIGVNSATWMIRNSEHGRLHGQEVVKLTLWDPGSRIRTLNGVTVNSGIPLEPILLSVGETRHFR